MKKVPVTEIEDGMLLAKPILGTDGKILLAPGVELKATMSSRLRNWGVVIVNILEERDDTSEEKENKLNKLEMTFEQVLENPNMKLIYDAVKKHIMDSE
ncbi:MAG: hypothetical protein HQK83_03300 [Fibrobacteria bacterium]|nr:hypothetical protein [Fibrobacteria bacterium]